jgi:hypothetical protein
MVYRVHMRTFVVRVVLLFVVQWLGWKMELDPRHVLVHGGVACGDHYTDIVDLHVRRCRNGVDGNDGCVLNFHGVVQVVTHEGRGTCRPGVVEQHHLFSLIVFVIVILKR